MRKGLFLAQALRRMTARFEETGHLAVQPSRGRKSTHSDVVEDVATAIVEKSMDNGVGCSNNARAVSRHLGVPYNTVWNVPKKWCIFSRTKLVTISSFWPSTRKSD